MDSPFAPENHQFLLRRVPAYTLELPGIDVNLAFPLQVTAIWESGDPASYNPSKFVFSLASQPRLQRVPFPHRVLYWSLDAKMQELVDFVRDPRSALELAG